MFEISSNPVGAIIDRPRANAVRPYRFAGSPAMYIKPCRGGYHPPASATDHAAARETPHPPLKRSPFSRWRRHAHFPLRREISLQRDCRITSLREVASLLCKRRGTSSPTGSWMEGMFARICYAGGWYPPLRCLISFRRRGGYYPPAIRDLLYGGATHVIVGGDILGAPPMMYNLTLVGVGASTTRIRDQ